MSTNLKNRSIALGATFALLASGFVATAPAAYAASTVGLAPTTGTNLGAFTTDDFEMDVKVPSLYTVANTALKIENPDKEQLSFQITGVTDRIVSQVTIRGFSATGVEISLSTDRFGGSGNVVSDAVKSATISNITDRFTMDFSKTDRDDGTDITSIVIEGITTDDAAALIDPVFTFGVQLLDGSDAAQVYGAGNGGDVTVTAWSEIEAVPDTTTVDAATASAAATVKFYDPKGVSVIPSVKRFVTGDGSVYKNDGTANGLNGSLRYVRPDLNLNQVDGSQWVVRVNKQDGTSVAAERTLTTERVSLAGTRANDDTAGEIYIHVDDVTAGGNPLTLDDGLVYNFRVFHTADATRTFNSVAFNPPTNTVDRELFVSLTDTDNADQANTTPSSASDEGVVDTTVTLRTGTAAFTYKARLYTDDTPDARAKVASAPILAVVTAGPFMPTGTTYSVSGSNDTLSAAGQAMFVSGLTNSDGDYSVTVTSSNPVAATSYDVEFFSLSKTGTWINALTNRADNASGNAIAVTYGSASVTSSAITVANSVLAGATVTAAATIKDSYGVVTNKSGTKDLYISVVASDDDDLKETVAVDADGSASITFANYVASGESDLINMHLHTGASWSTTTTNIATEVISLYNPAAVSAVNAPATVTGTITYADFITGVASSTNVAPATTKMTIRGTAVDANGSGVPGAVITVDADGMQLRKNATGTAGTYAVDSITFAADAAGGYAVDLWAHTVNTTGVDITITSDGKTATTKVKTYLPGVGVDGNNLVFGLDIPSVIDLNRTYGMTANLTDKWGNPIQTITVGSGDSAVIGASIVGAGSVEINSVSAGVSKNFDKNGTITVFVRSIKDIEGPGTITATLNNAAYTYWDGSATATAAIDRTEITTDVVGTAHDETSFTNTIEVNVNVGDAPASTSTDTKVNAGSFKGYVALYAKGYEGQRMSAIVAGKWLQVDSLASNFERIVRFTGAGYDINIRIYIDGKQVGEEFNILTK